MWKVSELNYYIFNVFIICCYWEWGKIIIFLIDVYKYVEKFFEFVKILKDIEVIEG